MEPFLPMSHLEPHHKATTLLFHDGELEDVRALLTELCPGFVERRGVLPPEDRERSFELVVGTPQRVLSLEFAPGRARPTQIAICDSDTRSMRNSLYRAGIQLMVRRPVHPAALRALLLHSLYRGPEKRRSVRVSIGAPLRFRARWRKRAAILADLSIGGCRLLTPHRIAPGKAITLRVPPEIAAGRSFSLKARILRELEGSGSEHVLAVKFDRLRSKQLQQLKATIKAHASGPATFRGQPEAPAPPRAPTRHAAPAAPQPSAASPPRPEDADGERRAAPRHDMNRTVLALDEQATRVLMGRDISLGGMCVNPNPLLQVGNDVRIAIHLGDRDEPLVVDARVHRDDGERGVVLRFHQLSKESTRVLDRLLDTLPVIAPGGSQESGMIVSELLAEAR